MAGSRESSELRGLRKENAQLRRGWSRIRRDQVLSAMYSRISKACVVAGFPHARSAAGRPGLGRHTRMLPSAAPDPSIGWKPCTVARVDRHIVRIMVPRTSAACTARAPRKQASVPAWDPIH
jgi:hypothetical protein